MSAFEIQAYDLQEIGRRGRGTVRATIVGYWSQDPISATVERAFDWTKCREGEDAGSWKASFSHSSGGRDANVLADDLEAATNFATAMIALAATARAILAQRDVLEAAYQAEKARRETERDAERAAAQAKIDADPALGIIGALRLAEEVKALAKSERRDVTVTVYRRGEPEERGTNAVAYYNRRTHAVTFWDCKALSFQKFAASLAEYSARTCIKLTTEA